MEDNAINRMGRGAGRGFMQDGRLGNGARLLLSGAKVSLKRSRRGCTLAKQGKHFVLQRFDAALAHSHGRDHGNAKICGKSRGIECQSVAFSHVDHVEGDNGGDPLRDQFARKAKVIVQIACINHNDQRIRPSFSGLDTSDDVAGDLFIGARWLQAVGAG